MIEFCRAEGIAVIAHSPLRKGTKMDESILKHPTLTPSQVTLRWSLQQNATVIPGATETSHLIENFATPHDGSFVRLPEPGEPVLGHFHVHCILTNMLTKTFLMEWLMMKTNALIRHLMR